MPDLVEVLEPYVVEPPLDIDRLVKPPRPLLKGERWDGRQILYTAAWIDDKGDLVPFPEKV